MKLVRKFWSYITRNFLICKVSLLSIIRTSKSRSFQIGRPETHTEFCWGKPLRTIIWKLIQEICNIKVDTRRIKSGWRVLVLAMLDVHVLLPQSDLHS